jgi:hypothetical protein
MVPLIDGLLLDASLLDDAWLLADGSELGTVLSTWGAETFCSTVSLTALIFELVIEPVPPLLWAVIFPPTAAAVIENAATTTTPKTILLTLFENINIPPYPNYSTVRTNVKIFINSNL